MITNLAITRVLNKIAKHPAMFYGALFFLILPIVLSIHYWQNDEWVYYQNVSTLLSANFKLHSLTAPTFYSTGFLAVAFSIIFGISKLPVLTLGISIICGYLVFKILQDRLDQCISVSILLSLLILFNPLFVFTTWGFMTDNYFLCFFLSSIYFLTHKSITYTTKTQIKAKYFTLGNILAVIAYFTRQLGILIPLALTIWLILNKKYKEALFEGIFFIILALFHFFLFPKSSESLETKFVFSNLTYFRYIFSMAIAVISYLGLFLAPLFIPKIGKSELKSFKNLFFILIVVLGVLSSYAFVKSTGWVGNNLYYLKYTVQRDGFFTENLHGTKNGIDNANGMYSVLDVISRTLGIGFVLYIFIYKKTKKLLNFYSILLLLYCVALLLTVKVYDRYLIPIFPLVIMSCINLVSKRSLQLIVFIVMLFLHSYNFSADYILTNNYVWTKSMELSSAGVDKGAITATDAWRYLYPSKDVQYKFTYDDPSKQSYSTDWKLIDKFEIVYPAKVFSNSIYLYQRN